MTNVQLGGGEPPEERKQPRPIPQGIGEKPIAPAPETGFDVPPAGAMPPGISGQPPIATGGIIQASLTPGEREAMIKAGIDPDKDQIPTNVAKILQATAAGHKSESESFQLPVPPGTPPVSMEDRDIVDINTLDPDERQRYLASLQNPPQATQQETPKPFTPPTAAQLAEYSQQQNMSATSAQGGLKPPAPVADKPTDTFVASSQEEVVSAAKKAVQAEIAAQEQARAESQQYANMDPSVANAHAQIQSGMMDKIQIDDDRDQPTYSNTGKEKPQPTTQEESGASESHTGAGVDLSNCPHCQWPLAVPDPVEPSQQEKDTFLASQLGRIPFVKTYDTFGGRSRVTFRNLTTLEMDEIHKQVAHEAKSGKLLVADDFFERVNRYRLYLQLLRIETPGQETIDLPQGWSKKTNAKAETVYEVEKTTLEEGETYLPQLEEYMLGTILPTESLIRAYGNIHAGFNRLVAKMEALVDNSDFWNETVTQP